MNTRKNSYDTSSSAKPNNKEEFEKKNPKSLTSVLLYIRSYFFGSGLSRKLFSEYLDIRTKRNYAKTISEDVLEKLERDKTTATYAHIERYADFLEIPTAIIFLISRITSDIEKNNINDLAQMAEGLEEISQYLKRNLDVLSKREKRMIISIQKSCLKSFHYINMEKYMDNQLKFPKKANKSLTTVF